MTQFFKRIKEADAAIKDHAVASPNKIETVEIAARKLTSVLAPALTNSKLHTTTRRFVERESKLQDALFFALERVLEVKNFAHHLKREDLEKLRNTKVSKEEVDEILEKFNTGLIVYHATPNLEEKERILISQVQEIVATYLSLFEKTDDMNY